METDISTHKKENKQSKFNLFFHYSYSYFIVNYDDYPNNNPSYKSSDQLHLTYCTN